MEMEANTFLHLLSLHKTQTEAHLAYLHHPTFHHNCHCHQHSIHPCHQPQSPKPSTRKHLTHLRNHPIHHSRKCQEQKAPKPSVLGIFASRTCCPMSHPNIPFDPKIQALGSLQVFGGHLKC
ncbi:hypothetical protein V8G54_006168 [Vigna mungo]|uniref:Uncharacterized protein n=1 Tax=Vigna mungo TaxID=3915 RepID=A0AAQ3P125_VIGMU